MGDFDGEVINAREAFAPPRKKAEPKIDELISKLVGKSIYVNDVKLIKLISKWKQEKLGKARKEAEAEGRKFFEDELSPDNFLDDPKKVEELKKTL